VSVSSAERRFAALSSSLTRRADVSTGGILGTEGLRWGAGADEPAAGASETRDAFPGDTLTKLRRLKARDDPDNMINQNFPIVLTPRERAAA
jgi:hypothetical protein